MRLRTQNMLFLLPVFLVTIVVMGGYKYYTEREVLLSGQENKANAFAVSIAEFLTPSSLNELRTISGNDDVVSGKVELAISRILDDGLAVRLSVHDPKTFQEIYAWGQEPSIDGVAYISENREWFDRMLASDHQEHHEGIDTLVAYPNENKKELPPILVASAPVDDGFGRLAAVVMVEMDASGINQESMAILRELARICCMVLLIGAAAALALSFVMSRSIKELTRSIQDVQSGNLNEIRLTSNIREIAALENTYNTMIDVLREEQQRDKDELMQIENLRIQKDLENVFRQVIWPEISIKKNQMTGYGVIHDLTDGDFMDLIETGSGLYAIIGRIVEQDFTAVVSAASVVPFWRSQIASKPVEEVLELFQTIFEFDWFCCCAASLTGPPVLKRWLKREKDAEMTFEEIKFETNSSIILHSPNGKAVENVERFVKRIGHLEPKVLHQHLSSAMGDSLEGPIVILHVSG
ncbi:hypothetical protein K8I31_11345 [bacterium]|nr:hypothetical protein [bacterium]